MWFEVQVSESKKMSSTIELGLLAEEEVEETDEESGESSDQDEDDSESSEDEVFKENVSSKKSKKVSTPKPS